MLYVRYFVIKGDARLVKKPKTQQGIHILKINRGANEFITYKVDGNFQLQYL